ncbi:unnamed protein product [Symbiodinium pilosum]|uniref:tRNA(Phe) (4-demethylwyosine(37)-C(7)) aminocarboxypropyltransferase n=1 Tax=Symbiodinium pilosum TaxID=2952 RepID=A0A812IU84_SYMPI|nr:unnamed protein product [Symbiodinium pilosum]
MFDPRFYTKAECCGSGWAVLDPYTFSVAPLPAYPSSQDWTIGHPSLAPDQLHWEALIQHASVEKRISSTVGTVSLKVFKGDMPHVQVYNLDASGQVAPSTILDVGANYGGVAVALAKLYSYARFVVLEPNPLLCRFLLWNLRRHGLTNRVWPLCAGAAPQIGEVLMQPCHEPWIGHLVNSCMNMAMRTFNASTEASSAAVVKVPTLVLREVLHGVGWTNLDLLKLDCEGCEWRAALDPAVWPAPSAAVGELHFNCADTSCWPPRAKGLHDRDNCSHAEEFGSLEEMWELVRRCG